MGKGVWLPYETANLQREGEMWAKSWPGPVTTTPIPMLALKMLLRSVAQLLEGTHKNYPYSIPLHYPPLQPSLISPHPSFIPFQNCVTQRIKQNLRGHGDPSAFSDTECRSQRRQLDKIHVTGRVNHTTKETTLY